MSVTLSRPDRVLPGVAMMLGFCAIAPLIDVAAKLASQSVSLGQVTVMRMVVQAALMLIGSTFSFVAAVRVMPLADALAIVFVEPFILLALGYLIFGDHVGPRRIAASVVGFAGALLVIQPNFAAFGAVALFPLATAVFFALYMLLTRRIARDVAPEAMQALTALWGTALMAPALALGAALGVSELALTAPAPIVWVWLVGVGVAATVSHLLITYALRFAPAATLAPLHYLEILVTVALGWLVFRDWPNPTSWAGIALIVAAGLYVIARERALARQAPG